jgi:hypothetical protein
MFNAILTSRLVFNFTPRCIHRNIKPNPVIFTARWKSKSPEVKLQQRQRALDLIETRHKKDSIPVILESLVRISRDNPKSYYNTYNVARYLLKRAGTDVDKDTLHTVIHCLIDANAAPDGSVARVLKYLAELEKEQISLNQEDCVAVLKALAVHPDLLLRTQVLQYMESSWIGLTDQARHYVVAGLLRELQLERAMEELRAMKRGNLQISPWLYDLAISVLANIGELEEVKELLRLRGNSHQMDWPVHFKLGLLNKALGKQDVS